MTEKLVVGLMSGTSTDGIDAALVRIKENSGQFPGLSVDLLEFITFDYSPSLKRQILDCCDESTGTVNKICELNFKLGDLLASAVIKVVKKAGFNLSDIDLIGSHGHTIYHQVNKERLKSTLQIGTAAVIAERTGITTVSNFRVRDIAAGGEGAPLVPCADYLLFTSSRWNRVLQNIGGIANYTYLPKNAEPGDITGTDTGPGNMLIDGAVFLLSKGKLNYDKDGEWASKGRIDNLLLDRLMQHPFIKKEAPKTTGREVFGLSFAREILKKAGNLEPQDIIATVTAFTACSIVEAYKRFLPGRVDQIIVSGGGARNSTLLKMMGNYCQEILGYKAEICKLEKLGMSGDAKEAVAFALLAYQTLKGRTNNIPRVTGADRQVVLGDITPGKDFFKYFSW